MSEGGIGAGISADLRRAFVNMAAKAGSLVAERLAQLALVLLVPALLGPVSLGRFSYATSVTALLAFGTDLGLTLWTTRALAREPERSASVLGTGYHLRLYAMAPYFVCLAAIAWSLGPGEARVAMLAIGVAALARACLDHARAVFRARERIGDEAKVNAISAGLSTIGALAAIRITGRGLPALALGMMAGTLLGAVYGFALLGRRYGKWTGPFDPVLARRMLREALPFWLAGIFSLAYARGDVVLLRAFKGDAEVGTYRAAGQLFDVAKNFPAVVMTAMFPQLARDFRHDRARLRRTEWAVSAGLAGAGILAAALVALAARFVAMRVFGPAFTRTVPVLHILALALPLVFINSSLTHLLVARDLGSLQMIFAGLMVPINLGANLLLSRRLGGPGAAWSMLITEASLTLLCLVALRSARRRDPVVAPAAAVSAPRAP